MIVRYKHEILLAGLTFNSKDLIVNSPIKLLHISLSLSYKNLVLFHDNNL